MGSGCDVSVNSVHFALRMLSVAKLSPVSKVYTKFVNLSPATPSTLELQSTGDFDFEP
jgi:hypothetical protein